MAPGKHVKAAGDHVRSCADLARELEINCAASEFVELDEARLGALSDHIARRADFTTYARSRWDDPRFWNVGSSSAERSQYFAVGNAINFRFWRLNGRAIESAKGVRNGERFTGSMYLWRSLRLCLDAAKYPLLDAAFLASLSEEKFDAIFADDVGVNPLSVAKEDRIANLRDLGTTLIKDWDGKFYNVVRAAEGSLARFSRLSARFRAFDDPVLKLTMVNAILHSGSGVAEFDADPLPGIDYHLLKQILRQGVLRPNGGLASKLEKHELLAPAEGLELRRVALCAFIRIAELTGVSSDVLDNRYWWNRSKCRDADPVCLQLETARECPFYGPCEQLTELAFPVEETRYY